MAGRSEAFYRQRLKNDYGITNPSPAELEQIKKSYPWTTNRAVNEVGGGKRKKTTADLSKN